MAALPYRRLTAAKSTGFVKSDRPQHQTLRFVPHTSAAMMAFALRGWANKIFDNLGKPRDRNDLVSDIAELFNVWEKGKSSNKLSFKFQTPEENELCKSLVKTFKLDKQKGYNNVSSLTDARYAITGQLVEEKGYPLWSLKFMDQEFCHSHPFIILNDDIRHLMDNIVKVCEPNQDMRNSTLISDTVALIERYRADLPDIISKPGNFRNGFMNFLLEQPGVDLQESELDSAYDYIKKHLESTVGYWTETEVKNALKDWRIAENKRIEEERRRIEEEIRRQEEERRRAEEERKRREEEERRREEEERRREEEQQKLREEAARRRQAEEERNRLREEARNAKEKAKQELQGDPESVAKKKLSAREYLNGVDSTDTLRQILNEIINLGYEFVIDKILETYSKKG